MADREFFEEKTRRELKRQREANLAGDQLEVQVVAADDDSDSSDGEDSGYGRSSPYREGLAAAEDFDAGPPRDKGKKPMRNNTAASQPGGQGQEHSSQDTDPNSSQESADSSSDAHRSDTRKRRRKIIKPEAQESLLSADLTLHPDTCGPTGQICRHPTIGHILPPITDGSLHPPNVVFNHVYFSPGEATDDQVRYIISRCSCQNTMRLEQAWQDVLKEAAEDGQDIEISKEEYLSHFFADWLNQLVRRACPTPSFPQRVEIDLTMDDD